MAQANSVQREPSMEEILASIRRIIEDSDTDKKRDVEAVAAPIYTAPANDVSDAFNRSDSFHAEFHDTAHADEEPVAMLDEGDSGLREASGASETGVASAMSHSPINPTEAASPALEPADYETPQPEAEAPAARTGLENADDIEFDMLADIDVFAGDLEEGASDPVSEAASGDVPARPPLISEQAGRQVAAAFGELSEAFAASRRRSFDEMAEEMLRPMLQDWLDNNLPHLVERLVREEIERIARA